MKRITTALSNLLRKLNARRDKQRRQRAIRAAVRESLRRIQVREFHGKLVVSFDDAPFISADDLKKPLAEALNNMRANYQIWRMEEDEK